MRVAIAQDREQKVAEKLTDSGTLEIYEVEAGEIQRHYPLPIFSYDVASFTGLLEAAKVDAFLCRDIEKELRIELVKKQFIVVPGVIGTAEGAIRAFLNGSLQKHDCTERSDGCDGNCSHCAHQEEHNQ